MASISCRSFDFISSAPYRKVAAGSGTIIAKVSRFLLEKIKNHFRHTSARKRCILENM
nr:MAG TPA: hypothetical protein [Caudoviricetes sp.]